MLSKYDIERELNKGINIVPFQRENIKENSINLSASIYAWTTGCGSVFINKNNEISDYKKDNNFTPVNLNKGDKCVIDNKFIVLLPHSTTLIQTEEVLAVKGYIGGTYHSKVGIVAQGIGHIGTMLGPNFAGHSLLAIHNITETPIKINVGSTFVSVVFHRLETSLKSKNSTVGGHLEKFSELGIRLSSDDRIFLSEDWKSSVEEITEKMKSDKNFIKYKSIIKQNMYERYINYINKRNIIVLVVFIGIIITPYILYSRSQVQNQLIKDIIKYYYQVGLSGIAVIALNNLLKLIKKD